MHSGPLAKPCIVSDMQQGMHSVPHLTGLHTTQAPAGLGHQCLLACMKWGLLSHLARKEECGADGEQDGAAAEADAGHDVVLRLGLHHIDGAEPLQLDVPKPTESPQRLNTTCTSHGPHQDSCVAHAWTDHLLVQEGGSSGRRLPRTCMPPIQNPSPP